MNIWESNIPGVDSIIIDVKIDNIAADITTDVKYRQTSQGYMPTSLYQLVSSPYSESNPPLTYLNDKESLMRGEVGNESCILQIDNATKNIIKEIGWDFEPEGTFQIKSEDVPDSGAASAYENHWFYIDKDIGAIKDPCWELSMPLADGSIRKLMLPDEDLTCCIPPIYNEEEYNININGDIECSLKFYGFIEGKRVKSYPFKICLELKPFIESATIEKITSHFPEDFYDAHFKVKYKGADYIMVFLEEEYGSSLPTQIIRGSDIATGVVEYITAPFCAWIHFEAENKYGKSEYVIALGPYGEVVSSYKTFLIEKGLTNQSYQPEASACLASNLISHKVLQDDEETDISNVLIRPQNIVFSTLERTLTGIWKVSYLNIYDEYVEFFRQDSKDGNCSLSHLLIPGFGLRK